MRDVKVELSEQIFFFDCRPDSLLDSVILHV